MAAMSGNQPKEKRRNSEKRKEKSRDAARCRRSKESEIFSELATSLPLPSSISSQLDKASVMRLTIAYLKARTLLANLDADDAGPYMLDDTSSSMDSLVPRMLDGFLIILSGIGDIVYITENVGHHLGLAQIDMIGQSIFDYSHPCDHNEMRDSLALRTDGIDVRSFFMRFKCTLTTKGRSVNLKSASYKVIRCNGRMMTIKEQVLDEQGLVSERVEDFLVLVGEPIPHPASAEEPLDHQTFLTKHTMDFKYTYVDDKIANFMGYHPEELEGKSALELHHTLDNDVVMRSYKTLLAKGQSQSSSYRFLARNGGYVWLETQSTVMYGSRDSRPQTIVCVHHVLSDIEEADQVLSLAQAEALEAGIVDKKPSVYQLKAAPSMDLGLPEFSTSKTFAPRTADMNKGYLDFDEEEGITVIKEEPEDLTHLAPMAGDACIPLEMPASLIHLSDLLEDVNFPAAVLDCFPLTAFEFPAEVDSDLSATAAAPSQASAEEEESDSEQAVCATSSVFNAKDPFVFASSDPFTQQVAQAANSRPYEQESFSPVSLKPVDKYDDYMCGLESPTNAGISFSSLDLGNPMQFQRSISADNVSVRSTLSSLNNENGSSDTEEFPFYRSLSFPAVEQLENCPALGRKDAAAALTEIHSDEEDFEMRAPFIPMGDTDDLPLFGCDDLIMDTKFSEFLLNGNAVSKGEVAPIPGCDSRLATLLQTPPVQVVTETVWQTKDPGLVRDPHRSYFKQISEPSPDNRGLKRRSGGLSLLSELQGDQKRCRWAGSSKLVPPVPQMRAAKNRSTSTSGGGILVEECILPRAGVVKPAWKSQEPIAALKTTTKSSESRHTSSIFSELASQQKQKQQQQQQQSNSVLLNLLVSGHDDETGYSVSSRNGSKAALSDTRRKSLSSLTSSKPASSSGAKEGNRMSAKQQLQQQLKARIPGLSKATSTIYPLLSLTSYDCEVNAPLQSVSGLLQGDDLLDALDLPLEFETSA